MCLDDAHIESRFSSLREAITENFLYARHEYVSLARKSMDRILFPREVPGQSQIRNESGEWSVPNTKRVFVPFGRRRSGVSYIRYDRRSERGRDKGWKWRGAREGAKIRAEVRSAERGY